MCTRKFILLFLGVHFSVLCPPPPQEAWTASQAHVEELKNLPTDALESIVLPEKIRRIISFIDSTKYLFTKLQQLDSLGRYNQQHSPNHPVENHRYTTPNLIAFINTLFGLGRLDHQSPFNRFIFDMHQMPHDLIFSFPLEVVQLMHHFINTALIQYARFTAKIKTIMENYLVQCTPVSFPRHLCESIFHCALPVGANGPLADTLRTHGLSTDELYQIGSALKKICSVCNQYLNCIITGYDNLTQQPIIRPYLEVRRRLQAMNS